jgi:hypothetical protein
MKKFLFSILVLSTLLFPANVLRTAGAQGYRYNGMTQSDNRYTAKFEYNQPYYNGLNGNGSYYSARGGNNYRSFTYRYPTRPSIVVTPYSGIYLQQPNYYGNTPYPSYNYYNGYSGYIYPW